MNSRYVGMLSLGHLITDINQGAVPALLPFLIAEHHLSYAAAAGIVFATNFSSTIVQPVFGYAADRFSKPWLMMLGVLFAGVGMGLTGVMPGYGWIVLAAVISGIGIAAFHPEAARLVNFISGENKATAISIFGIGGTLGFATGPVLITAAILNLGLNGTLILFIPVCIMAAVLIFNMNRLTSYGNAALDHTNGSTTRGHQDEWAPFIRLTLVIVSRAILFYSLNTFIPLYWIHVLHQTKAVGGTALTIMAGSGVIGNLLGGRCADRWGHRKVLWIGLTALVPLLPALLRVDNAYLATMLLVPIGFAIMFTFSPAIIMGQSYLPNHIGLSSGITIGVAIAIGGIAAPVVGKVADIHGIRFALTTLMFLPVISAGIALTLPIPKSAPQRTP